MKSIHFKIKAIIITLMLIGVVSIFPTLPRKTNAVQTSYKISTSFGQTQSGNWRYEYSSGSDFAAMTWNASINAWSGSKTNCRIGNGWMHPDQACIPTLAFIAPTAGLVNISGMIDRISANGDGIQARILKNSTQIWPSSGYQEVAPRLSVNATTSLQVKVGDYIRFQILPKADTSFDTTNWDPTVTYDATPNFVTDKSEPVAISSNFATHGLSYMDSSLSYFQQNNQPRWLHTFAGMDYPSLNVYAKHTTLNGPLNSPLASGTSKPSSLFTNAEPDSGTWGWWFNNIYQISDTELIGFMHLESCNVNAPAGQRCRFRIAIAYSNDSGQSFKKVGHLISQKTELNRDASNIEGVAYAIKDGEIFMYYNDFDGTSLGLAVAKMQLKDLIAWAKGTTATPACYKLGTSGWSTTPNCRGGDFKPIMTQTIFSPCIAKSHGDAAWIPSIKKFVMIANAEWCQKNGMWINFSSDGINWESGSWLQNNTDPANNGNYMRVSQYATIVNTNGTDNGVATNDIYAYWGFAPEWDTKPFSSLSNIYRQKISFTSQPVASPSPAPSATPTVAVTISCPKKNTGDANCDDVVNMADYDIFRAEYGSSSTASRRSDFNNDGKVTLADFEIWRARFLP